MNILVAEDNPLSQRLIQHLLLELGHRVTLAADGHAALAQLEAQAFDLVLMDVQMPGLSGLEAATRWRARERAGSRVPMVALTARAMSGDAESCLQAGMDGYLQKPLDIAALERVLERTRAGIVSLPSGQDEDGLPYRRAVLEHRVGSDARFLLELSGIFEARADLLIAQIGNAIEAREAGRVKDAAHELKGMLLNLAATEAYRTVRELEAAGRSARYDAASACLARLVEETPRLLSALRERATACAAS